MGRRKGGRRGRGEGQFGEERGRKGDFLSRPLSLSSCRFWIACIYPKAEEEERASWRPIQVNLMKRDKEEKIDTKDRTAEQ